MWLFIVVTIFAFLGNFSNGTQKQVLEYSEFIAQVESDQVLSVQFLNDNYTIKGKTVNGEEFETVKPPFLQDNLSEVLREHRVQVAGQKPEEQIDGQGHHLLELLFRDHLGFWVLSTNLGQLDMLVTV